MVKVRVNNRIHNENTYISLPILYCLGGALVHYHILSTESQKFFKRAIAMSGTALAYWASSEERNHQALLYQTFEKQLNHSKDPKDMLKFMKEAEVLEILQLPLSGPLVVNGPTHIFFTPVVDSELSNSTYLSFLICSYYLYIGKAEKPFLTEHPIKIYEKTKISKEAMFGYTTAVIFVHLHDSFFIKYSQVILYLQEAFLFMNDKNLFNWVDRFNNDFDIEIPVHHLNLSKNSKVRLIYF